MVCSRRRNLRSYMQLTLPKAILFDMDGTLTDERIDFAALRAELGLGTDEAILEAVARMPVAYQAQAERVIDHYETQAAERSTLNAGCLELLKWLDDCGIARALITRNTRQSVRTVFDLHGVHFDVAITREDGAYKPDPAPLFKACQQLNVSPANAWMVGDWKYDIEAANRAGVHAVWLSYGRERPFDAVPDRTVVDLLDLSRVLTAHLNH